jgi:hypothetical protein
MQVLNGMNRSDGIVSGKFQVGDRVHRPKTEPKLHGSIVEIEGSRCRVFWDADEYRTAKRTWVNQKFLAKVQ